MHFDRSFAGVSLEKRPEGTYAEYCHQKASASGDVNSEYLFGNVPAAP
jgi:hypothetical protein